MSETVVAGASMSSTTRGAAQVLGRLGIEAEQVQVHVAGIDVQRRAVDEEGVVEEAFGGRTGLVCGGW